MWKIETSVTIKFIRIRSAKCEVKFYFKLEGEVKFALSSASPISN